MNEMQSELASSDRVMHQRLANTNARLTERLDETSVTDIYIYIYIYTYIYTYKREPTTLHD